jgi:hypothetical protein
MASKQASAVRTGSTGEITSGTPVQLTTESIPCIGVWVSADSGNAGKKVIVGDKNIKFKLKEQRGIGTHEFTTVFIEIDDPSKLWVDVETSKDKVTWTALVA